MNILADILIVAVFLGFLAFVLLYSLTPFWRTEMGRHVMSFMASLGMVMMLAVLRIIAEAAFEVDLYADAPWLRPACFALIAGVTWWRVWILIKVQFLGRDDDRREAP